MCISREEAEDLVHETLAKASKKPRSVEADDTIGYLLRVLRNKFLGGRRFAQRRPAPPGRPEQIALVDDLSAAQPETRHEFAELYRAIASLPEDFRDALIAVDLMGLSHGEAARALGVREATISPCLHRGRRRVAEVLAAEC
jgi:RNA polymerase sigma-70 factor (ECF subfamily)